MWRLSGQSVFYFITLCRIPLSQSLSAPKDRLETSKPFPLPSPARVWLCQSSYVGAGPHSSKDSYSLSHEFPCTGKWACMPHFLYPALPEPEQVKEIVGSTDMLMSFLPSFYHKDGFPITSKQSIRYFRNRVMSLYSGP